MQNKYAQALVSAVIYAIIFPLLYRMFTHSALGVGSIALSTAIFFVVMLVFFSRKESKEKKN